MFLPVENKPFHYEKPFYQIKTIEKVPIEKSLLGC
jgi:hypothetical protein